MGSLHHIGQVGQAAWAFLRSDTGKMVGKAVLKAVVVQGMSLAATLVLGPAVGKVVKHATAATVGGLAGGNPAIPV